MECTHTEQQIHKITTKYKETKIQHTHICTHTHYAIHDWLWFFQLNKKHIWSYELSETKCTSMYLVNTSVFQTALLNANGSFHKEYNKCTA